MQKTMQERQTSRLKLSKMKVSAVKNESGAIVVEATLSLTAFVFAIFTILNVVNICYIQARMGSALDSAAKEMAQYSYLYYKIGADKLEQKLNEGTEDARDVTTDTIDGVVGVMDSLSDAANSASSGEFDNMISSIESGANNIESLYNTYGDKVANDPKQFIIGFAKMAGNEIKEEAKVYLAQVMAKGLMKKNLKAFDDDDADAFLKRYHVINGMDGLDFNYTALMAYGSTNKIQLVCTYKVKVIQFFNIDFEFQFRQMAKTNAWGNGVSLIKPEISTSKDTSIWDNPNDMKRGQLFVVEEKKKFKFIDKGHGFDAYVNDNGKNEFVTIVSHNVHLDSLDTSDELKKQLRSDYRNIYNKVSGLGEEITIKDGSENGTTIHSNPDTRTYVVRMVVPDDSDMTMVNKAVADFEREMGGNVNVEVITGYGSPSKK